MWECKKCRQTFEQKPLKHGNLVGNVIGGFKDVPCDGEIVHVTKPYYEVVENKLEEKK